MSRRTLDPARLTLDFAYGIVTLFDLSFNTVRLSSPSLLTRSVTPEVFLPPVWAAPISLATTLGIVLTFFSSGY